MDDFAQMVSATTAPKKIAVIGDLMLDEHIWCEVLGISPEDDIAPKLKPVRRTYSLGGAANVAHNLATMGVEEVTLFGRYDDENDMRHNKFAELAHDVDINLVWWQQPGVPISLKSRILTPHGRHIARLDEEVIKDLPEEGTQALLDAMERRGPYQLIIVSDYNKGMITPDIMEHINQLDACVLVDPKGPDWVKYGHVYAVTPNEKEAYDPPKAHNAEYNVVTLTGDGCAITPSAASNPQVNLPTRKREQGDPAGCGDSFIAGLGYALVCGLSIYSAARFANAAGACAYDHTGVRAVTRDEVQAELKTYPY